MSLLTSNKVTHTLLIRIRLEYESFAFNENLDPRLRLKALTLLQTMLEKQGEERPEVIEITKT